MLGFGFFRLRNALASLCDVRALSATCRFRFGVALDLSAVGAADPDGRGCRKTAMYAQRRKFFSPLNELLMIRHAAEGPWKAVRGGHKVVLDSVRATYGYKAKSEG